MISARKIKQKILEFYTIPVFARKLFFFQTFWGQMTPPCPCKAVSMRIYWLLGPTCIKFTPLYACVKQHSHDDCFLDTFKTTSPAQLRRN